MTNRHRSTGDRFPGLGRSGRGALALAALLGLAPLLNGCAVNPVTGDRQFTLITERQEIAMGRDADQDITASLGLYEDEGWQAYVQELGDRMARTSERPDLPWTFRVVDDPTVNAFALPGGFIYLTRGILTHFRSEAELAGVLGHEIGHVTARHGVSRASWGQLAQLGLGIGAVLAPPDWAPVADVAGAGVQLLFLSWGRDAERQADDLGLRYMTGEGYDPREMAATFEMLASASGARDGDRIPGFLSTHPDPLERRDHILQRIEAGEVSGERVERQSYLERMDGMIFGTNPRHGFFRDGAFFHPDMAFRLDFPEGWRTVNQRQAVQGINPEQDAALILTLAEGSSAREARDRFLADEGITGSNRSVNPVHGLPAASGDFSARTQDGTLRGTVTFVEHGGRIFRVLGYTPEARWSARQATLRSAAGSFREVTDPEVLNISPSRIELVRTDTRLTLEQFHERYPSTVPIETIGTINHVQAGAVIPAGTVMKRVVGGS